MTTQAFDDGSTFTYNDDYSVMTSTPSPFLLTNYGSNTMPSLANPSATNWGDVLLSGFSRYADYKMATIAPQNVPVQYSRDRAPATPVGVQATGVGSMLSSNWLLIAGVGLGVFAVARALLKKS